MVHRSRVLVEKNPFFSLSYMTVNFETRGGAPIPLHLRRWQNTENGLEFRLPVTGALFVRCVAFRHDTCIVLF